MESLTISPRFFKHELNNYYQWERAFWRELIQNSVDEHCTKIQIEIRQLPPAHPSHPYCTEIKFQDNGPGMSEETLRNVYFKLGATSKDNPNATSPTIGGHGRARIITCFAHEAYTIRTQNILCQGAGGSFHIDRVTQEDPLKGCHIQILTKEATEESLKNHLCEYLKTCQLTAQLTINSTHFCDWLHRRRATRLLSFGTIHTTKKKPHSVLVRVQGVTMFEKYSPSQIGAIIEIEPTLARSILTASRDSLKFTAQEELEKFLQEIAIDNKSLIRDQTTTKTEIYGECKPLNPSPTPQKTATPDQPSETPTTENLLCSAFQKNLTAPQIDANNTTKSSYDTETHQTEEEPYSLHFEDATKPVLKAATAFGKGRLQGRRKRLLQAWDTACRLLIQHVCEKTQQSIHYMPGFVFSPHLRGMHKKIQTPQGQAHILYLNPLTEKNTLALSPKDYHTLYALAAHEATHILHPLHNEDFAGTLTELIEKTATALPQLKKTLREKNQKNRNPPK